MLGWVVPVYIVILFIGSALLVALALVGWQRAVMGSRQFALWALSAAVWSFFRALEALAQTPTAKVWWAKVEYLGAESLPVLFLLFALAYTRPHKPLSRRAMLALWVVPIVALVIIFTNELHGWFWSSIELTQGPTGEIYVFKHGFAFWLTLAYNYALILAGSLLFVQAAIRSMKVYRRQSVALLVGVAVPWVANAVYIAGLSPLPGLDLTPLSFMIAGMILGWDLLRFRFLDLAPVARDLLIEELGDGVLVLDMEGRVIDLNPAACDLIGIERDVVGQASAIALPAWLEQVACRQEQDRAQVEIPLTGQPRRYMEVHIIALRDHSGELTGNLVLLRDITASKRLDKLREDMIRTIVHDLRNPLGNILMILEMVRTRQDAEVPELLDLAERSVEHMLELVNSILDINRLERGQLPLHRISLDVASLIEEALSRENPLARKKSIQFSSEIAPDLPPADGDLMLIRRVLQNLIGNAVTFTPSGGKVHMSAGVDAEQRMLLISVADTGLGIPAEVEPYLFQTFAAGQGRGSGSGVGLAFCRLAVEAHGGRIWAENVPQQGATFYFTIPMA